MIINLRPQRGRYVRGGGRRGFARYPRQRFHVLGRRDRGGPRRRHAQRRLSRRHVHRRSRGGLGGRRLGSHQPRAEQPRRRAPHARALAGGARGDRDRGRLLLRPEGVAGRLRQGAGGDLRPGSVDVRRRDPGPQAIRAAQSARGRLARAPEVEISELRLPHAAAAQRARDRRQPRRPHDRRGHLLRDVLVARGRGRALS